MNFNLPLFSLEFTVLIYLLDNYFSELWFVIYRELKIKEWYKYYIWNVFLFAAIFSFLFFTKQVFKLHENIIEKREEKS